jgi:hypothetical protein
MKTDRWQIDALPPPSPESAIFISRQSTGENAVIAALL